MEAPASAFCCSSSPLSKAQTRLDGRQRPRRTEARRSSLCRFRKMRSKSLSVFLPPLAAKDLDHDHEAEPVRQARHSERRGLAAYLAMMSIVRG